MKKFLLVLIVLGLAGGGWWWWQQRTAQPVADNPFGEPSEPAIGGGGALTPQAKAAIDAAEQAWNAAGDAPATSAQAPRLAQLFTAALAAVANQQGGVDEENRLVSTRLAPLGDALFFSKTRFPNDPTGTIAVHVVQAGEHPDGISRKYGMSTQLLNRLRGHEPNSARLLAGDALKVVNVKDKGFHIRVDKSQYTLDLFIAGIFARRYPVTHGAAESPTPVGRTKITQRVWHPPWTHPVKKITYAYGDPENILGPVWMAFDAQQLGQGGIGIHGYTGADAKLGVMASNGCIRLANDQAEELFFMLSDPGRATTTVEIFE